MKTSKILLASALKAIGFVVIVCGLIIGGLFMLFLSSTVVHHIQRPKISKVTTPLDADTVQDLCVKLELVENHSLCGSDRVVYAPDFFPAIKSYFEPGITTYDDVQAKLARYQYEREPTVTTADGVSTFRSSYDFRGDKIFLVSF